MTARTPGRAPLALALLLGAAGLPLAATAQTPLGPNERLAEPHVNVQDRDDTWVLEFKFKDPRLITVDVPGRGKKVVYYLWYQVINKTPQAHTFLPDFELVTHDRHTVHRDQVLPRVQEEIRKVEDPTGYLDIKNSVTMAAQPIPPSRPDAVPSAVTGLAIFPDVVDQAADTTQFSIYVAGLSNGWTVDDKGVVRRKTLQLNFRRFTDALHQSSQDIKFVPPPEWIYRATTLKAPAKPGEAAAPKDTDK